jgi:hypothetical protein
MPGAPPVSEGWPTLSELKASEFDHFRQFADYCDGISGKGEKALEELAQEVRRPGGVEWEGAAGDAAVIQADMDVVKARPFLWGLPDTAVVARRGQDTLEAGKQLALDAVDDAERDGFQVGEDYSVTDTQEVTTREQLAERQAQAEAHSNFIRHRVAALVANDQHITGELKNATAGWGKLTFNESPAGATDTIVGNRDKRIQPVDRTWKQGPDQPGPGDKVGGPSAADIQGVTGGLPRGTSPDIKLVQTQQQLEDLYKWASQNGTKVPDPYGPQPGTAYRLPDGTRVGMRDAADSTKLPALDIKYPGPNGSYEKVHINAAEGATPQIPSLRAPVEAAPPPAVEPAPPSAAPRVEPAPIEPRLPVEPPAVAPPRVIGGGGGGIGGGGIGMPGLGHVPAHTPTE